MNFALYLRASTDTQSDSYGTQRRILSDWCERNGHAVVAEYVDEALSGGLPSLERPAAARLLADVADKHRTFDGILVIRLDRLSRDPEDRINVLRYLARHKCGLWTPAGEETFDSPVDALMQRITAAVDGYERQVTGMRIREHNLARAMQGKMPAGYAPLGYVYNKESKQIEVSERADDARFIFMTFVECAGNATETAKRVNRKGIRSQRGNTFSTQAIFKIVRNPFYRRIISYAGREVDASEHIPPLIDPATLAEVDRLLPRYGTMPSRAKEVTRAYSEHLVCERCGAKLHHSTHQLITSGDIIRNWRCPNRARGLCDSKRIATKWIDRLVGRALARLFATIRIDEPVTLETPAEDTATRKRTLEGRRARWAEMYAEGLIPHATLRARVEEIDAELAGIVEPVVTANPVVLPEESVRLLALAAERWETLHEEEKRGILAAIGALIEVRSVKGLPRRITLYTETECPPIAEELEAYNRRSSARVYSSGC